MEQLQKWLTPVPRLVLALVLLTAAIAKLAGGHQKHFVLGREVFYSIALIELVAASLLMRRRHVIMVAWLTIATAVAGIVVAWRASGSCGCLGRIVSLTKHQHLMFAVVVGLLACAAAYLDLMSRRTRSALSTPPKSISPSPISLVTRGLQPQPETTFPNPFTRK